MNDSSSPYYLIDRDIQYRLDAAAASFYCFFDPIYLDREVFDECFQDHSEAFSAQRTMDEDLMNLLEQLWLDRAYDEYCRRFAASNS